MPVANPVSGFTKSLNWRLRLFASANKISVSACRYNPLVYAECMRKATTSIGSMGSFRMRP